MNRKRVIPTALFALAIGFSAMTAQAEDKKDIVDTAVSAGQFKTLAAALKAADLVDALKGDGPFTVFAPTDAAFEQLPEGTVESLLKPENKDKLTAILTYHVVKGKIDAEAALEAGKAKTLNGKMVRIRETKKGAQVNKAKIVKTDIIASNGIIHVIDTVLLPPEKKKKK